MDKFSIKDQGRIKRAMKTKMTIEEIKKKDLRARRKFQCRYVANYSLSDIPEEDENI